MSDDYDSADLTVPGGGLVDFGRFGDWTSWSSVLVLLAIAPLTVVCLLPFSVVAAAVLPGGLLFWTTLYFLALPLVLIPGLKFLQIRLVVGGASRRPTEAETARLTPAWNAVLAGVGRGSGRRYRLMVMDDHSVNAAAGGGNLVFVTSRALQILPDDQLRAVLAHELGHHVGLHPFVLLLRQWLVRPFVWASRLSIWVHNVLAWFTRRRMHWAVFVLVWVAILVIRLGLFILDLILKLAMLILMFFGRRAEYRADKVAVDLGYGNGLIRAFATMEGVKPEDLVNLHATVPLNPFENTHPPIGERFKRIRKAMAAA